jgi:uncharacterized protein YraI
MIKRHAFRARFLPALLVGLSLLAIAARPTLPVKAAGEVTAVVNVGKLNLRAGPGFAYLVIKVLDQGQRLSVLGRSANSVWIEVRLPDGSGGWVYAYFVRASARLADLPVTEAAGGPTDPSSANRRYSLYMTISDNQAVVNVQKFPANTEMVVTLSLPDGSASLVVARSATDASGSAEFSFPMPRQWPDGRRVTQSSLVLVASTLDQTFSRSANIQYYR